MGKAVTVFSFDSRFKQAHSCQKKPNLHNNSRHINHYSTLANIPLLLRNVVAAFSSRSLRTSIGEMGSNIPSKAIHFGRQGHSLTQRKVL
jgi:hypothetical protein